VLPRSAASLLIALVMISCTTQSGGSPSPSIAATNAAHLTGLLRYADGLPLATPDSFKRLLAQMEGTPVVVNIWASWCGPCKTEMPFLAQVSNRYSTQIQFLGVDIGDTISRAKGFIGHYGIRYPSVFDPTQEIKASLGFQGQPDTVIYTSDGSVLVSCPGPLVQSAFLTDIQQLANLGTDAASCT
jgi:cytochrome c biogenesis protein CcmG/thiol:disulfide interchange protein DsbE